MRRFVAAAASVAYRDQSFATDDRGFWVNRQGQMVIVSPAIHTARLAAIEARVLDGWCYSYRVRRGDIVVDAGAGVGEEAIVFSSIVGCEGKVISIEAEPTVFECLKRTVRSSGLSNVRVVHCAVADKPGTARITDSNISSTIMSNGGAEVPQGTIAEIVGDLPRIDLLKMNIEGAEKLAVLAVPWEKVRNVVISCHDFCGFPSKKEVIATLKDNGFETTLRPPDPDSPWHEDYVYARRKAPSTVKRDIAP